MQRPTMALAGLLAIAACAPPASVLEPARVSSMPAPAAGSVLPLPFLVERTGERDIGLGGGGLEGGARGIGMAPSGEGLPIPSGAPRSGPGGMP